MPKPPSNLIALMRRASLNATLLLRQLCRRGA